MTIGRTRNAWQDRERRNPVGGYAELSPVPHLRPFVEYLWVHVTPEDQAAGSPHRVVADAGLSLAFTCRRHKGKVHAPALKLMGPVATSWNTKWGYCGNGR